MPKYYCSDCDCIIDFDIEGTTMPVGCTPVSGGGSINTGWGQGGGEADKPDSGGAGSGLVNGNSPFGMPFGLGLGDFMKDVCKWLPAGFCDKINTIVKIIIIVLICLAVLLLYNTFKK